MTRRLMLWLTSATILFWLAAAGYSTLVMRDEFDEVFDSALEETAQRLAPLIADEIDQRDEDDEPLRLADAGEHDEYVTYQARAADGRVLMHSHDADRAPFAAPLRAGFFDGRTQRFYTLAVTDGLFVQVAEERDHRREALSESAGALLLPLAALAPLSMIAIWLIVRRALAPIGALSAAIGKRDGGNLDRLEPGMLPDELATIAGSVDRLLDRLRGALDAERAFAANSAHELRTPIAGALAQTQRLLRELPEGATRERARSIEAALARLANLAEKLLQLARAEAGIGASAVETDLVPLVSIVTDEFARGPAAGRLATAKGADSVIRRIDPDAFGIVLRNLIENALRHGDPGQPVALAIDADGTVSVTNGGAPVPARDLAQLTARFRRGSTQAEGSGLGLAIADTLMRAMGGRLELASPAPGRRDGFRAAMRFDQAASRT